jgi:hypothetical protein
MAALIGKRKGNAPTPPNAGQALALTDVQFLRLFASIKNPAWKITVGLVGAFGLRGLELNHIAAQDKGLYVYNEKRIIKGKTKLRLIPILDPKGRAGLGHQLLLTLRSDIVELPPLGS